MFNPRQVFNIPLSPDRNSAEVALRDAETLRRIEGVVRITEGNASADAWALADHIADRTPSYAELMQPPRLQP
jgi:hypothetical protein